MSSKTRVAIAATAGVCLAAASILALAGCNSKAPANSQGSAKKGAVSAVRVETVPVTREDLKRVSEATPAELLPYEKTDLYAKVSGFLKEIRVDYGDPVRKGDVLALLWVPELEVELEQKQALVEQAAAEVKLARDAVVAAEAEFRWRKGQFERLARVEESGVLDKENVKEAQYASEASMAKRDMARSDVAVKEARLKVAKVNQDQVKTLLQYTKVEAPYDAVVTRRHLHTGAFLDPKAGQQPLLTVVRTDILRVVVDLPEKDVRYLGNDNRVVVDLDALPGQKLEWKITRMAPVLGSGKKVRVEVDIPNPDGKLYPGMYGHASIILEDKPQALTVPASCLGSDDKGPFVWLVVDGTARRRQVKVGSHDGRKAEITTGLSGTEEVICSHKEGLREGQAILAKVTGTATEK